MSISANVHVVMALMALLLVIWLLRWALHRFFGMPLDMAAERERFGQEISRNYRLMRRLAKWYFRR
jgi:uncharacterized protein HemY